MQIDITQPKEPAGLCLAIQRMVAATQENLRGCSSCNTFPAAVGCKGTFTLGQASLPCMNAPQSSFALQVDLTYVEAAAKAAKAGGVRHFSLVTSKGASARLPAPHFAGLHPLLYLATKGRAEEAVKAQVQRGLATWLTCAHWGFPAVACCMACVGHGLLTCI